MVMHVEVDGSMSVEASHRVTGGVKELVCTERPEIDTVLIDIETHAESAEAADQS